MELWKDNLSRNEQLLDQIWEMSVEYIENPKHKDLFLQTFMRVCAAKGADAFFDDLEVFDSDPPEFMSMTLSAAGTPEFAVEMGYGLAVWNGGTQLGKVTAAARGIFTCALTERVTGQTLLLTEDADLSRISYDISCLELKEIYNSEEYYDDYTAI